MVLNMAKLQLLFSSKRQGQLGKERIKELLELLRRIVIVKTKGRSWKRCVTVKARDLRYLGIFNHKDEVDLGKVLRLLVNVGLAYRANGCRPIRYVLKEPMIYWAYSCSRECIKDSSICGLYGQCPYHKLLGEHK